MGTCLNETLRASTQRLLLGALGLWVLMCCGCIHLHQPERQKTAETLQADLKAYGDNAPKMYEDMRNNVEKFRGREDEVLGQLYQNNLNAFIAVLPDLDGNSLQKQIEYTDTLINSARANLISYGTNYFAAQQAASDQIDSAKKLIKELKDKQLKAAAEADNWSQTVALLKTAASQLPSVLTGGGQKKLPTGQTLNETIDVLRSVGTNMVAYEDSSGKAQQKSIQDIVLENLKEMVGGTNALRLPTPPGIRLSILTSGIQVAEAERDRAQMQLNRMTDRLILYEDIYKELCLAKVLLNEAQKAVPSSTNFGESPLDQWIVSNASVAQELRKNFLTTIVVPVATNLPSTASSIEAIGNTNAFKNYQKSLNKNTGLFRGLRLMVTAQAIAIRDKSRIEIETKRLDHLDSIVTSQYNDQITQIFLASGVDGLVAYHRGGFTSEDAAQIVRIAQAIAVGVLAANSFAF